VARFPGLSVIPRVGLGRFPTPVEPLAALGPRLWIKRDDLAATVVGVKMLYVEDVVGDRQIGPDEDPEKGIEA